jgi:hypothetical protein
VAPATSANPALSPPGKNRNERGEKPTPVAHPSSSTGPGMLGSAPDAGLPGASITPRNKPGDDRHRVSPLTRSPDGTPYSEPPMHDKGVKKDKRTEGAPDMAPAAPRHPNDVPIEKVPRKPKEQPTMAPATREAPPDRQAIRPLPPERVAPPNREAPPENLTKRPLPPERVASPNREAPPDSSAKHPLPPERVAPPSREAPPEAPRKHPLPPERVAPPSGPGANGPAKTQEPPTPPSKRGPDKKTSEPSPAPGS